MISIFVRTFIIYAVLTLTMKVMGKREIGELDVSELVSTLLISEIAAIPIGDPNIPFLNALIPIILIFTLEVIISYVKTRTNKLKKCVEGEGVFLIYKKKIKQRAFVENRITINEFLSEMRAQGIGSIDEVEYALLEQSGKISILPSNTTTTDHYVIIDGEFIDSELKSGNFEKEKILSEIKRANVTPEEILLLSLTDENKMKIIKKDKP